MENRWLRGVVGLGAILTVLGGISPAKGQSNKLGGDERPVMEAMDTALFRTEDWVEGMEYSDTVGTGAIPDPASEELSLDDYHPD